MYFNFAIPDNHVPTHAQMIKIVHCMHSVLQTGKLLVHCHSGVGRTAIAIACYLLYSKQFHSPKKCIDYVQLKRPTSLVITKQQEYVAAFTTYLRTVRRVFSSLNMNNLLKRREKNFSLKQFLQHQSIYRT